MSSHSPVPLSSSSVVASGRTSDAWSACAKKYDASTKPIMQRFHHEMEKMITSFLRSRAASSSSSLSSSSSSSSPSCPVVLDVGCGSGHFPLSLANTLNENEIHARIIATDYSPGMIQVLQQKIDDASATAAATKQEKKVYASVTAMVQDAMTLTDVHDQSVDVVVSSFAFFMVPDPAVALKQIHRVLRPGGLFIFSCWASLLDSTFHRLLFSLLASVSPDTTCATSHSALAAKLDAENVDENDIVKITEIANSYTPPDAKTLKALPLSSETEVHTLLSSLFPVSSLAHTLFRGQSPLYRPLLSYIESMDGVAPSFDVIASKLLGDERVRTKTKIVSIMNGVMNEPNEQRLSQDEKSVFNPKEEELRLTLAVWIHVASK